MKPEKEGKMDKYYELFVDGEYRGLFSTLESAMKEGKNEEGRYYEVREVTVVYASRME